MGFFGRHRQCQAPYRCGEGGDRESAHAEEFATGEGVVAHGATVVSTVALDAGAIEDAVLSSALAKFIEGSTPNTAA